MIFNHWLATLLGGSLAVHGALGAITLNVDDESESPRSPDSSEFVASDCFVRPVSTPPSRYTHNTLL